jgi:hypothetical protein
MLGCLSVAGKRTARKGNQNADFKMDHIGSERCHAGDIGRLAG